MPNYRGAAAPTSLTHRNNPLTKKSVFKKSDTAPPADKQQKRVEFLPPFVTPEGFEPSTH